MAATTYGMLARDAVAAALGAGAGANWISLHNGDPGATGANEVTSIPRKQTTFAAPVDGEALGSMVAMDVGPNTDFTHYGRWTASTGGTFHSGTVLPGSGEHYSAAGQYFVTPKTAQGATAA
jgi:hypothetical protein